MIFSSIYATVLAGPTLPIPLSSQLTEVINTIEVVQRDSGRSGFKIEFYAGREGLTGITDYVILQSPSLKLFNRVQILVTINGLQQVLMDGIITDIQVQNVDAPGGSKIVVMGQDISLMMDRKQMQLAHPSQPEAVIVEKIITSYSQYGLIADITSPPLDTPNLTDWIPRQYDTDYAYIKQLAQRFGYVFCVIAGPTPGVNTAYWGPSKRTGIPQPALAANMGYGRNVNNISFRQNALAAVTVNGEIQDRTSETILPIEALIADRLPLSSKGALTTNAQQLLFECQAGLTYSEAQTRAQAITNRSRDRAVVVEGSLDTSKYGRALQACRLIGVQGAGLANDGLYYVEQVTHQLGSGYYHQQFTLTRDGTGPTVPMVLTS